MRIRTLVSIVSILFFAAVIENTSWAQFKVYDPDGTGLGEKFVVTSDKCLLYPTIGTQGVEVPPLTLLWRLEVPNSPNGLKQHDGKYYYHVGNAEGEEWGWIEKNDEKPNVTSWNTRFLHCPIDSTDTQRYEVFADEKCTTNIASFTKKPQNTNIYAFITQKPGEETAYGNGNMFSSKPVFFYCGPMMQKGNSYQRGDQVGVDLNKLSVEVVFVVDTTRSMEPLIGLAQKTCNNLVEEISRNHPEYRDTIRFGLVEFRDEIIDEVYEDLFNYLKQEYGPEEVNKNKALLLKKIQTEEGFTSRVVQPLNNKHGEFLQKLNNLKCCQLPNGDEPEQVGCGLMTAIQEMNWDNNSVRHIILLGDSPNKQKSLNPDNDGLIDGEDFSTKNLCQIPGITDRAKITLEDVGKYGRTVNDKEKQKRIYFHAIGYGQDPDNEYEQETELQFSTLAKNGGSYSGYFNMIRNERNIDITVNDLVEKLLETASVVNKARAGKVDNDNGNSNEFSRSVWQLAQSNQTGTARPLSVFGYARAKDSDGNLVAEPMVLILYDDLENLKDYLVSFRKRLERYMNGKGNLKMIFEDFKKEYGESAAGGKFDDNSSIDDIIDTGFPIKTDVLQTTFSSLSAKTDDEFKEWVEKLDQSIKDAEAKLANDKAWTSQGWQPPKGKPQKFQYMKVSDLP